MSLYPSGGIDHNDPGDIDLVRRYMVNYEFTKTKWYIYGPQAQYIVQYHQQLYDIKPLGIEEVFKWYR